MGRDTNYLLVNMDKAISPKRKKSSFTFEQSRGPQSSVITGVLNTEREKD